MAPKKRLGEILVESGLISADQLQTVLASQKRWGGRLGDTLIEMGLVKEPELVQALSRQMGIPAADLSKVHDAQNVTRWLKKELAEKYGVFPLGCDKRGRTLQLATTDPTNYEAEKELTFHTGMAIQLSLAGPKAIQRAIRQAYYGEEPEQEQPEASPRSTMGVGDGFRSGEVELDVDFASPSAPRGMDLSSLLLPLQQQQQNQSKALRAVLELLQEKGHLGPDELPEVLKRR